MAFGIKSNQSLQPSSAEKHVLKYSQRRVEIGTDQDTLSWPVNESWEHSDFLHRTGIKMHFLNNPTAVGYI